MAWDTSVTLALLGGSFLFAYLYVNSEDEHKLLRMLYLFPALILGFSAVGIQEDIINTAAPSVNSTAFAAVQSTYNMQLLIFQIILFFTIALMVGKLILSLVDFKRRKEQGEDDE